MQRPTSLPGLRLIGTAAEEAGVLSFVLQWFRTEDVGEAYPGRERGFAALRNRA